MYEMFDRQRRGAIGPGEFRTGCFELGLRLSPVEAVAVFGLCDARVDGHINYYGEGTRDCWDSEFRGNFMLAQDGRM